MTAMHPSRDLFAEALIETLRTPKGTFPKALRPQPRIWPALVAGCTTLAAIPAVNSVLQYL